MRIGAVARAAGVSERLLRYYEEQGLLQPERLPSGYRDYSEADVATVRNIRTLLAAGLPLRIIADVLPCICNYHERIVPSCPEFIVTLRRERARINAAIDELKTSQKLLDTVLDAAPSAVVTASDDVWSDDIRRAVSTS
ncbi:MAG: MerR family transcriptional regulator [Nocardiopsaceae bacterium]|jgi:DNA-binding transcriptional MerR regulator|nr:MerR family transcriptional regulator [Nocardiopsaceae bacterium]